MISEWAYLQYSPSTLAVSAFKCGLIHLDFDDLNETVDIACSLTSVCQVCFFSLMYKYLSNALNIFEFSAKGIIKYLCPYDAKSASEIMEVAMWAKQKRTSK